MKTKQRSIIFAAVLWFAQNSEGTKPVEIQIKPGKNVTLSCVSDFRTRLEPPLGCIINRKCQSSRLPLKYLQWSKSSIISTYAGKSSSGKYCLTYFESSTQGLLSASFFELSVQDSGLYRCGLITPAGRDVYTEYRITVTYGRMNPLPPSNDVTTSMSVRETSIDVAMDVKKIVGIVGENISIKCPLYKHLNIQMPPSNCIEDYSKCNNFFQPLLYLKREKVYPKESILKTQKDYAEYDRYNLSYGKSVLQVGIGGLTKADKGRYVCGVQAPSEDESSAVFEIIVKDVTRPLLLLLLLLLLTPLLLLLAGGLLILHKKRKSKHDSQKANASGEINTDVPLYENISVPASDPADSTYQTLCADTRETHIYSSLHTGRHSH